jgi:succinate dehydrogenase/fumarate reductase flavoprotein subunit
MKERHDVVVVGAGNAAFSAAHAAIERVGRASTGEGTTRVGRG